ncbi:MAG: MATE family efflux transporter [Clostridia bacterium]|nr:MATE family efflux transporter [Clostridia bacterium]
MTLRKRLIGPKSFYKVVLGVAVPIMIQNGITNFVSLLDNLMVGGMGTEQMSGVAIANQLFFVLHLCIFGGMSGAGIFTAQFHGSQDHQGVRNTFRFKLFTALLILLAGVVVLLLFGKELLGLYLKGDDGITNAEATAAYGLSYLRIMLIGLVPLCFSQAYSSTLRETGSTKLPMAASIAAVASNSILNYLLIFGKFGFPELGVVGAAIATVISRFIEFSVVVIGTHLHAKDHPWIFQAYRTVKIPATLVKSIILRGMPLLANELLWSVGMAMLTQCYSSRGLSVIAAQNISSTITNFFSIIYAALGSAVAILVGQQLGASKYEEAKTTASRLMVFSLASCLLAGLLLAIAAPLIPQLYQTGEEVRTLATRFLWINAGCMPLFAIAQCCYFILRSGGKTVITFIFDCVYVWVVVIPFVYIMVHYTNLSITQICLFAPLSDILKCVLGLWLVAKGVWINKIITSSEE